MITAMKQMIEWLQAYEYEIPLELQVKAKELLIIEKEQSINLIKQTCMFMGASIIDIEISKMQFEDIYNNYYNQNK